MQEQPKQKAISQLANNIVHDLKVLSGVLEPISKVLYQNNNAILKQLLIAKQQDTVKMIKMIVNHCLHVAQHKNLVSSALTIISKIISSIKSIRFTEQEKEKDMLEILSHIIDCICLISVQQLGQQISLRVVQATFSLIDQNLIKYVGVNLLTRLYSTFFEECKSNVMLKNICVSGLFALTQCLFGFGPIPQSFQILQNFLNYLLNDKKYSWIKGTDIKGLIWDLTVVSIKNLTSLHLIKLQQRDKLKQMLIKMYSICTDFIFLKNNKNFYNVATQNKKNNPKNIQEFSDFLRYFKAYVALSSSLSIEAYRVIQRQIVGFRATVPKLLLICDLQRNSRMFIFLESICQLLLNQYDLPLSVDKGIIFIQIISKLSEQLCLCNQNIKVHWQNNEYYLDKISQQQPKINDGDFVRLIKNTIFQLRLKYQRDEDLLHCKKQVMQSARSAKNFPSNMGNTKKWQFFIRHIIRTVRYLSSLGFVVGQQEQDPTRKIVLQLQYWFLISPSYKAKDMVLQQLLITSTLLTNKLQAVKVSQCVQIGSNIMYGYYEDLDSIGLTIILKMMAGVKADWEQGKSFEQLDQIYNLATNIFKQEKLIKNEAEFTLSIQAIVQCANSLLADLEQPKQKLLTSVASSTKRQYKMIQYLIERLIMVVKNNIQFAASEWNFITAFFITLCCGKNQKIRQDGIEQIGILVQNILKSDNQSYAVKKQQDIMGLYLQLSKAHIKQIQLNIIQQLKVIMPRIQHQNALMDGFRIAKIFSQSQYDRKQIISDVHELQQILIKECLFRIIDRKYLKMILDGLQIKFAQKNQQYRLINLYWNIADHFKTVMSENQVAKQFYDLWEILFKSMWVICENSQSSETKQSVIHATTQILGEASMVLQFDFIIKIIQKYYQEMVFLLLGIHPSAYIQPEKTSQTAKIALKNLLKTFKKLLSKEDKSEKQTQLILSNLNSIHQKIIGYMKDRILNQKIGNLSIQLLLQISYYILHISEDPTFNGYGLNNNLKSLFQTIEDIIRMCEQRGDKIDKTQMDLNSHLFKKKLKPTLQKIAEIYKKQIVELEDNAQPQNTHQ